MLVRSQSLNVKYPTGPLSFSDPPQGHSGIERCGLVRRPMVYFVVWDVCRGLPSSVSLIIVPCVLPKFALETDMTLHGSGPQPPP